MRNNSSIGGKTLLAMAAAAGVVISGASLAASPTQTYPLSLGKD